MSLRRVVIFAALIFFAGFGIYLGTLYRQLERAFAHEEQFVPTRIFSDVSRIAPPEPRAMIEERLKALAYTPTQSGDNLIFTLHRINFPTYLIPENHPQLDSVSKQVTLVFDSLRGDALLQSIHLGEQEVSDIYLEPEIVATLARSSTAAGDDKKEIRQLLKFEDIPAPVWKAILSVEDQHFLEHGGIDLRGILRAAWVDLRTHSLAQGGSTITEQLVKNLMARRGKSIFRKFNELFLAILLEAKYDKQAILERYLNEVPLGQVGNFEVHGVAEGAKHFFGKNIDHLNLAEIALMAGLIRGPFYYSPYRHLDRALERQHVVLRKMVETGQIAQAEADQALKEPIRLAPPQNSLNKAPYFVDYAKAQLVNELKDKMTPEEIEAAGFRVYTTLDMHMNEVAQRAVYDGVTSLEKRMKLSPSNRLEGALAAVDQSTGSIKALVGGRSYAQSTFNRILNMKRQVGSTFKPFVYLASLEKGNDPSGIPYGPGHPVEDAPWKLTYDHGRQKWAPKNYEREFMGWIDYRTALAHSINTVAGRLGMEVGLQNVVDVARSFGIQSVLPLVPSLSLGVADLSPIELLRAYAGFANHGVLEELSVIRGITHDDGTDFARFFTRSTKASDPGPADLLTDMLQNVFTEGTASEAARMGLDRPAAGKTGTTSNYRDSWFAGYTPELTTVVWVGADEDRPDPKDREPSKTKHAKKVTLRLTGATSALPIWVDFVRHALAGDPPATFPISDAVTMSRIDRHTGELATSNCPESQVIVEKYVAGHEPKATSCAPNWPPSVLETTAD